MGGRELLRWRKIRRCRREDEHIIELVEREQALHNAAAPKKSGRKEPPLFVDGGH